MKWIQLRNLAMVLLGASNVRLLSRGEAETRTRKAPQKATDPSKVVVVPSVDHSPPATVAGDAPNSPPATPPR